MLLQNELHNRKNFRIKGERYAMLPTFTVSKSNVHRNLHIINNEFLFFCICPYHSFVVSLYY